MEQPSPNKPYTLPDLIIRIGAGTPSISRNYQYYFARSDTPSNEAGSQEIASAEEINDPSRMPHPPTPFPLDSTEEDANVIRPDTVEMNLTDNPRGEPVKFLSATERDPGSGKTDPTAKAGSEDSENAMQIINGVESMDVSPQLPRNPAVTPAGVDEQTALDRESSPSDSSTIHVKEKENQDEANRAPKDGVIDYFSIPTRFVLHPETPANAGAAIIEDSVEASSRLDETHLAAPTSRPDSMLVHVSDTPITADFPTGKFDPDLLFENGKARTKHNSSLPEMQPVSDLDSLIRPPERAARDVMEVSQASHEAGEGLGSPPSINLVQPPSTPAVEDLMAALQDVDMESMLDNSRLRPLSQDVTAALLANSVPFELEAELSTAGTYSQRQKKGLMVRKIRSATLQPVILKLMLGRQLAAPTKAALNLLARGEELGAGLVTGIPQDIAAFGQPPLSSRNLSMGR